METRGNCGGGLGCYSSWFKVGSKFNHIYEIQRGPAWELWWWQMARAWVAQQPAGAACWWAHVRYPFRPPETLGNLARGWFSVWVYGSMENQRNVGIKVLWPHWRPQGSETWRHLGCHGLHIYLSHLMKSHWGCKLVLFIVITLPVPQSRFPTYPVPSITPGIYCIQSVNICAMNKWIKNAWIKHSYVGACTLVHTILHSWSTLASSWTFGLYLPWKN